MHPTQQSSNPVRPIKCPQTKSGVQPAALPAQMVVGFLPHGTPRSCVVVAKGWPSWLFIAPTLQLCCVKFYSDSLDIAWMITLLQHFPQLDVVDLNSLTENDLSFYPTDTVLLMQGNQSSLDGWMKKISTSRLCLLSLSIGHRPLKTGYWHDVSHKSCGGVTSGSWSLGSNKPFLWSTPHCLKRNLLSMIDSTVKCRRMSRLPYNQKPEEFKLLLHIRELSEPMLLPSVYMGCCYRLLTNRKLGRIFELPDAVAKSIPDECCVLPYVHAAPLSVLLYLGRLVLTTPNSLNLSMGSSRKTSSEAAQSPMWEINARQEEKASRSDDAIVPIHLWDDKLWTSTSYDSSQLDQFHQRFNKESFRQSITALWVAPWWY